MTIDQPKTVRPRRGPALAVLLFFVSPTVGEFLLGNLPVTMLWLLLILAPLYGGGAVLIREVCRRFSLGWPGILLLSLAYAIIEEAFTTQSLFNPHYLGLRLLDFGFVPALGLGAWWTVFVLTIHVVWSIATPIALVEALSGAGRREPWLGRIGITGVAVLFGLGCVATTSHQLQVDAFRATPAQLTGAGVVVAALVALAFAVGRRSGDRVRTGTAGVPGPRALLGAGLGLGSAFMIVAAVINGRLPISLSVGAMLATLLGGGWLLARWSRSRAWTPVSEIAFAGGILLTYVWYGFVQVPSVGAISPWLDVAGNLAFSAGAVALLARSWKSAVRSSPAP